MIKRNRSQCRDPNAARKRRIGAGRCSRCGALPHGDHKMCLPCLVAARQRSRRRLAAARAAHVCFACGAALDEAGHVYCPDCKRDGYRRTIGYRAAKKLSLAVVRG